MPWPVYTETFARSSSSNGTWSAYTVPAGRRAVVKSVSACNVSSAASRVFARVAGFYVLLSTLQASAASSLGLTVVAYAGQIVECTSQDATSHVCISGYLFNEALASGDYEEPTWEEVPWDDARDQLWGEPDERGAVGSDRSDDLEHRLRSRSMVGSYLAAARATAGGFASG